jgi:PilZ domain-containing protein
MSDEAFAQKRTGQRRSFLADADIILSDGTAIPAQLDELSLHGCYLDTLEPIAVGTEFHLRIVDGDTTCELQGKVIYAHSGSGLGIFGAGVVFTEMSARQSSAIHSWLRGSRTRRTAHEQC